MKDRLASVTTVLCRGMVLLFASLVLTTCSNMIVELFKAGTDDDSDERVFPFVSEGLDLDPTFGNAGLLLIDNPADPSSYLTAYRTITDGDGRVLVAGDFILSPDSQLFVARFLSDGTLDTSFASSSTYPGFAVLNIPGQGFCVPFGIALDSDGLVLVTGQGWNGSGNDLFLVRLTASGALDPGFNGGEALVEHATLGGTTNDYALGILVDQDGGIFVYGTAQDSDLGQEAVVWKYDASGARDASFGQGGFVREQAVSPFCSFRVGLLDGKGGLFLGFADGSGAGTGIIEKRNAQTGALEPGFQSPYLEMSLRSLSFGPDDALWCSDSDYAYRLDPVTGANLDFVGTSDWRFRIDTTYTLTVTNFGIAFSETGIFALCECAGGGDYDFGVWKFTQQGTLVGSYADEGYNALPEAEGAVVCIDRVKGAFTTSDGSVFMSGIHYSVGGGAAGLVVKLR